MVEASAAASAFGWVSAVFEHAATDSSKTNSRKGATAARIRELYTWAATIEQNATPTQQGPGWRPRGADAQPLDARTDVPRTCTFLLGRPTYRAMPGVRWRSDAETAGLEIMSPWGVGAEGHHCAGGVDDSGSRVCDYDVEVYDSPAHKN
jgi:hypothetical protein